MQSSSRLAASIAKRSRWRSGFWSSIRLRRIPNSLFNLWLAHVYSGNVDAALDVLDETLAIDPATEPARINLGFINARRGDTEDAARAFRRVEESTEGRRSPT